MIDSQTKPLTPVPAISGYRPVGGKIQWIDTAKALGLILVFWGHLLYNGTIDIVNQAIYSFHMPMYFILSGLVMNSSKVSFLQTVDKRFKRLLLPTIIFQLLSLPIFIIKLQSNDVAISAKQFLSELFYLKGHIAYDDPLWFFICLFQVLVFADVIKVYKFTLKSKIATMIGAFVLGYVFYRYHIVYLGLDKAIWALGFFMVGQVMKVSINDILSSKLTLASSLIVWFLTGVLLNEKFSMYSSYVGHYWCFVSSGIAGSLVFFHIAKKFQNIQVINQYAQWTVFIVMSHYFLVTAFNIFAGEMGFLDTIIFDITSFLFVIIALFCYRPVCKFVCEKVPILNGN